VRTPPPPFSALRAVEAAFRHRSFTGAARELNVTHSAISQSVRRLESELGAELFVRRGGGMQPSHAAKRLAAGYAEAAEALERLIAEVSGRAAPERLSAALPREVRDLWLPSRLESLRHALPDADVDFQRGDNAADVHVEFAPPSGPGEPLGDVHLLPVGSPALLAALPGCGAFDVLAAPLLEAGWSWAEWAAEALGAAAVPKPRTLAGGAELLEAARRGEGVALLDHLTAEADLVAGKLAALPFPLRRARVLALRPGGGRRTEAASRLTMWLKLELARTEAVLRLRSDVRL
jgi:DNA-binding transcriptional LysR family regulator